MSEKDPRIQAAVDQFVRLRSLAFEALNEANRALDERLQEITKSGLKPRVVVQHHVWVSGVVYGSSDPKFIERLPATIGVDDDE